MVYLFIYLFINISTLFHSDSNVEPNDGNDTETSSEVNIAANMRPSSIENQTGLENSLTIDEMLFEEADNEIEDDAMTHSSAQGNITIE